jgi:hypothetical protein
MSISIDEKDGHIEYSDVKEGELGNNNFINSVGNVFKKAFQGIKLFRSGLKDNGSFNNNKIS